MGTASSADIAGQLPVELRAQFVQVALDQCGDVQVRFSLDAFPDLIPE